MKFYGYRNRHRMGVYKIMYKGNIQAICIHICKKLELIENLPAELKFKIIIGRIIGRYTCIQYLLYE